MHKALDDVMKQVRIKLESAFWELDDIMVALSPDAPQQVADAWSALHNIMTPEFIAKRDKMRGLAPLIDDDIWSLDKP